MREGMINDAGSFLLPLYHRAQIQNGVPLSTDNAVTVSPTRFYTREEVEKLATAVANPLGRYSIDYKALKSLKLMILNAMQCRRGQQTFSLENKLNQGKSKKVREISWKKKMGTSIAGPVGLI